MEELNKVISILNKIKPNVDFAKEENLIENNILTSFDIIRLVVELNNEFDVEITPLYILPENFKSAKTILAMIEKIEEND